jgi:hypothetical protein
LFGVPKAGKTENAAQFPKPLAIATGPNTGTLERHGVPYLTPLDWGGGFQSFVTKVLPTLKDRQAHTFIKDAGPEDVETIIIDELNNLLTLNVDEIIGRDAGRELRQADFGRINAAAHQTLRDLASLKIPKFNATTGEWLPRYNVVCTCHLKDVNDAKGNLVRVAPFIFGQTRDLVGSFFDFIFLLARELVAAPIVAGQPVSRKTEFVAYTSPPDSTMTRLGLGGAIAGNLPGRLVLATPSTLYDAIQAQLVA